MRYYSCPNRVTQVIPPTVTWTRVNQSGHNASWVVAPGMNAVYGGSPHDWPYDYVGQTPDAATCESRCRVNYTAGGE